MSSLKRVLAVAMLSSIAITAWADDAPVFDVDNYPPQFDGQSDAGNTPLPPPPPTAVSSGAPSAAPIVEQQAQPQNQQSQVVPQSLTSEQRLARVEQQLNNMQRADSAAKLNSLQSEVQVLRGKLDDMTHQLQQMQSQQKAMYADLDKRLSKQSAVRPAVSPTPSVTDDEGDDTAPAQKAAVKQKPAPVPAGTKSKPAAIAPPQPAVATVPDTASAASVGKKAFAQPNVAEEQQIYQTAYDLIKDKKYDEAIAALQGMLKKYPSGQFAANAHYWLGELYGLQGKNNQSAMEFASVVNNYPDSPKVSDAQLKLGLIYAAQFKWVDAKYAFKKVVGHYPGSASARLAAEQLKQIKLAGH